MLAPFPAAGTVTRSAAFTRPNARSGGFDNTLKLGEVATGRELRTFTGYSNYVLSVAFSPDGCSALSGSGDGTLKLWGLTGR